MKRIEIMEMLLDVLSFKTLKDCDGNEYVFFKSCAIKQVDNVDDKVELEATINHVHLFDNIRAEEFYNIDNISSELGILLLNNLHYNYPGKYFMVYVSVQLYDSMIIRFHQKWKGEAPYLDANGYSSNVKIYLYEN